MYRKTKGLMINSVICEYTCLAVRDYSMCAAGAIIILFFFGAWSDTSQTDYRPIALYRGNNDTFRLDAFI